MQRQRLARGFTVIEVLIVLAIATMIMLIVFIVVPTVQRSARNYTRKHAADVVFAAMGEYYAHHNTFPNTEAELNDFKDNYATGIPDYIYLNAQSVDAGHRYFPELDTVATQYGHWCNRYGDGYLPDDPVAGPDLDPHMVVVWTILEPESNTNIYCIDNHR